jgi:CubicO group peptidase (beta-lactamase class C family)
MRTLISVCATVIALNLSLPATADPGIQPASPPGETADGLLGARLDDVIDRAIDDHRIIGAVVMIGQRGELIYHRAAGFSDREIGRPMRKDAIFRLASVTKPIVSTTVMKLVQDGKLGLDDPVTKWLPYFRPQLPQKDRPVITLRHLLTHTSGLGYGLSEPGNPYHKFGISDGLDMPNTSLEGNLRRLAEAPLFFRPGTAWRYSLSIDVLGAVLEEAAGAPLPNVVAAKVTQPLSMADTGFAVRNLSRLTAAYADGAPFPVRMAATTELAHGGSVVRFAPGRATDPTAYPSGGAGMVGTVRDIFVFLETIRKGGAPILKSSTVREMMRDQIGPEISAQGAGWGFGYGWAVLNDPQAAGTPQTRGTIQWGGVYGHSWFVDPERGLTVVALTNTAVEGMDGRFPTELRDAVYGR